MHRVRLSVHENRLVFSVISESDYREHLEKLGRGWVVEIEREIIGFAIANATNGSVWALFIHPDHERRGYGRQFARRDGVLAMGAGCSQTLAEDRSRHQSGEIL